MTAEWKEYTGSEEQIAEMLTTETGFIVNNQQSIFKDLTILKMPVTETHVTWLKGLLADSNVKQFLICNPHPLADMICQQARTGQPVWVRINRSMELKEIIGMGLCEIETRSSFTTIKTNLSNWNLKAQYSFTEFKEQK